MKIYLIEAEKDRTSPPTSDWFDTSSGKFFCPSLALPTIAALVPKDIEVKIIDEKIEAIDSGDLPDVAAISYKSMSSRRAYELADTFRDKGVKVILGGIHASLLPDEAKQHADSVLVGEGEEIWPGVVSDLLSGKLEPLYRAGKLTDIARSTMPRFALLKNDKYLCHSLQTSRGCSLDCEFCPTREMFGGIFRKKPIKNVVREIQEVLAIEKKDIFFSDDIFGAGDKNFILELLKAIQKLKIRFYIISDFLILDKDIIGELAKSGCRHMALNLPGTCSEEEAQVIKVIQGSGIDVWGYFMFGFPFHEKNVFKKAYDFVKKTNMKNVSFTVMAPYPNTNAGKKLDKDNKLLTKDWSLYDQNHVVFEPQKMSSKDLGDGFNWIKSQMGHLSRMDYRSNQR